MKNTMLSSCLLILAVTCASACSSRDDGTPREDSGVAHDSGSLDANDTDLGTTVDLGTSVDLGNALDLGSPDLGTTVDASIDAGIMDGGPAPDFGRVDAGRRVCGGFGGVVCGGDEYCNYPLDAICGYADGTGECAARPASCDDVDSPVCGCNGENYINSCRAAMAGTGVYHGGICETTEPHEPEPAF